MKKILVNDGDKRRLCRMLNVSYPTVRVALSGSEETLLQKRIRTLAIEIGGVEVDTNN